MIMVIIIVIIIIIYVGCCLHRLPSELLASIGAHFLGQPQPVARLVIIVIIVNIVL